MNTNVYECKITLFLQLKFGVASIKGATIKL